MSSLAPWDEHDLIGIVASFSTLVRASYILLEDNANTRAVRARTHLTAPKIAPGLTGSIYLAP